MIIAQQRVMQLTEAKKILSCQLSEFKKYKDVEQINAMKEHYENVISYLEKENAVVEADKEQVKECMMKDIEALNQQLNRLQRQLDKQQGSKPCTS
jgi:capsule polysaccharide export protein KpsE/RkpR